LVGVEGVLWWKCHNYIRTTLRYKKPKAEAILDRQSESMKIEKEAIHVLLNGSWDQLKIGVEPFINGVIMEERPG
jgi:hypothetical protein